MLFEFCLCLKDIRFIYVVFFLSINTHNFSLIRGEYLEKNEKFVNFSRNDKLVP